MPRTSSKRKAPEDESGATTASHQKTGTDQSTDTPEGTSEELMAARALIEFGAPVIVCTPHKRHRKNCPKGCEQELDMPPGWSSMTPKAAERALSRYRPGTDTLALVTGHGIDVMDVDPKSGGSVEHLPPGVETFGETATPSGGVHRFVRSTGFGKVADWTTSAGFVGDYLGGTPDGGSRALAFLPGSSRPKYPDVSYRWTEPLDLARLAEADPDDMLFSALLSSGASRNGHPGKPAATLATAEGFVAGHSTHLAGCNRGVAIVKGLLAESADVRRGGRHPWAARAVTRVVELMKSGCCDATDLSEITDRLHEIKPEGGREEWLSLVGWAIENTEPDGDCQAKHVRVPVEEDDPAPEHSLFVDLSWLLTGTPPEPEKPTVCRRKDGLGLFYVGKVNGLFGDPECGKTWVALVAAAETLADGGRAAVLDVDHNGPGPTTERLLMLGATVEQLADPERFRYASPDDSDSFVATVMALTDWGPEFVLLDSLGEILPMMGASSIDNDQITGVLRLITRIATEGGTCVVVVDHLPKGNDARASGYAIGGTSKKRAMNGSYIRVTKISQIARGKIGSARLTIEKDRHGGLREGSSSEGQAGVFTLDDSAPQPTSYEIALDAPTGQSGTPGAWRPTEYMEKVSIYLEELGAGQEASRTGVADTRGLGGRTYVLQALDLLASEGWVEERTIPHQTRTDRRYRSVKKYRQTDDPAIAREPDPPRNPGRVEMSDSKTLPDPPGPSSDPPQDGPSDPPDPPPPLLGGGGEGLTRVEDGASLPCTECGEMASLLDDPPHDCQSR